MTTLVPTGNYALINHRENRVYFFAVERPETGKWAGFTFLVMFHGDNREDIKGLTKTQVLRAIAENPLDAAQRYGREVGECPKCHAKLTDPKSIAYGIGPVCKKHYGAPEPVETKQGLYNEIATVLWPDLTGDIEPSEVAMKLMEIGHEWNNADVNAAAELAVRAGSLPDRYAVPELREALVKVKRALLTFV